MDYSILIIDSVFSLKENYRNFLGIFAEYNKFRLESMLEYRPELTKEFYGPNINKLFSEYNKSIAVNVPYEGFFEYLEAKFQRYFKYFVMILDGVSIAQASILEYSKDIVILHWVYVKPDYRKKQYAYDLLKHIIQVAKKDGFSKIYLETIPTLTDALKLYEKFGFRYRDYYESSNLTLEIAKKYDFIFMEYDLLRNKR